MRAALRHNVAVRGLADGPPIVFAHGFGCDQGMWRHVAPAFERDHLVVLFDHAGLGGSPREAWDPERHATLDGYATDVLELLDDLDLAPVTFVGHSVSSVIGALAANRAPERFASLVMLGPSPRYVDDPPYVGGFQDEDIRDLLDALESNYLGWSTAMAPVIVGNPDRPELGDELAATFCRADPDIARTFAHATFLADNRADLAVVRVPTLVVQCSDDAIAPTSVGRFVHEAIAGSAFVQLQASAHCPQLSAPDETIAAIRGFVGG
jgi:sigma-B regulation protein RsbQ